MGIWDPTKKADFDFYKKLDESGNPTGNLFVYKNVFVFFHHNKRHYQTKLEKLYLHI